MTPLQKLIAELREDEGKARAYYQPLFAGRLKFAADMLEAQAAEIAALQTELKKSDDAHWYEGAPEKFYATEWFIAETTYGDRVVLTALPEEYTYDFKTADDTYIMRNKIKRWMQFHDSKYLPPAGRATLTTGEPT